MTRSPLGDWPFGSWFGIGLDAWRLSAEASQVVALRGVTLARGGLEAWQEAERMISEKSAAGMSLGMALAAGKFGANAKDVARGTLGHYRRRVRANRRRLTRR